MVKKGLSLFFEKDQLFLLAKEDQRPLNSPIKVITMAILTQKILVRSGGKN
jgi:hypothetical protein